MIVAKGAVQNGCIASAAAEVMALIQAIHLCKEMGFSRVNFEGDAKFVMVWIVVEWGTSLKTSNGSCGSFINGS
jgi:ribonuclease HI